MEKYYTKSELLFFLAYIIFFTSSALELTRIKEVFVIIHSVFILMKQGIAILLILKILEDKVYTRKELIAFVFITMAVALSQYNSGVDYLLFTICLALTMKKIKFSDVLKVTIVIQIVIVLFTFIFVAQGKIMDGIYGDLVWGNTIIQSEDKKRHDLGYFHPNSISAVVFFLSMMILCVKKNIKFWHIILGVLLNYLLYMRTGSRTSFLLAVSFLPFLWFMDRKKEFSKFWKKFFCLASIAIPIIAMAGQIFYNPSNEIYEKLNQALSGRIGLGHNGFFEFGGTLFGQQIVFVTDAYYKLIDCAYMYFWVLLGGIFYFLFVIGCFITMKRLVYNEQKKLCVAFFAWMVFGMIEAVMLVIAYEPFCLLLGQTAEFNKIKKEY